MNTARSTLLSGDGSSQAAPQPMLRRIYCGGSEVCSSAAAPIPLGVSLIGRGERAWGPALPDPAISERHATLRQESPEGGVELRDEGSTFGTFVGRRRVERHLLEDGEVIRVGDSFLLYRIEPPGLEEEPIEGLLGGAPSMRRLRAQIKKIADSDATVLILGETGVGKDVVARALHRLSRRVLGPRGIIDCAGLKDDLIESELFGHEKGSFTGAAAARRGIFEEHDGGTVFIDELGELPLHLQPRLLRVIQFGEVRRVGSNRPIQVDVRILAATNRELLREVEAGRFRRDLLARLSAITLRPPPLRERREDILGLFLHHLGGSMSQRLPVKLVEHLLCAAWQDNVRGVEGLAKQVRVYGAEQVLEQLPEEAAPRVLGTGGRPDRDTLRAHLLACEGNLSEVARRLDRSRRQVHRWLAEEGIDPAFFRRGSR